MRQQKQLWVIVGNNGSGRTTFYHYAIKPYSIPCVDRAVISSRRFSGCGSGRKKSDALAAQIIRSMISNEEAFCLETDLSALDDIELVAQAKASGYKVISVYIYAGPTNTLLQARTQPERQEIRLGGDEPLNAARHLRTLHEYLKIVSLSDEFFVFDNSSVNKPFTEVLTYQDMAMTQHLERLPNWAQSIATYYHGLPEDESSRVLATSKQVQS